MTGDKKTDMRSAPKGAGMPKSVLVVEDDALLALATETSLLDAGVAEVETCATSEQALAALRAKTPGAVVLDVHLADRDDGWAVAELLETMGPKGPRIIFATGTPEDIPARIAELGCILEKPYDPELLIDALRSTRRRGLISRIKKALS